MSIRRRLVFSYTGLSFLAVLTLGTVLYSILRTYYTGLERAYLQSNAVMVSQNVMQELASASGTANTDLILMNYAFLTRTRVRIYDAEKQEIGDSGEWNKLRASMAVVSMRSEDSGDVVISSSSVIMVGSVSSDTTGPLYMIEKMITPDPDGDTIQDVVFTSPVYTYSIGQDDLWNTGSLSRESVTEAVYDGEGNLSGYVELSEGPAYGQEILTSVLSGWAASGLIAVLVAVVAGWIFSRRFSEPLQELTGITRQMSHGDLSARANHSKITEYHLLADSFNEMADRVEKTIAILRRFAADAAHELQTPLTALRTNLELAKNEAADAQREYFLEASLEQTERMNQLAGNLLDLSRLETGSTNDETSLVNLNQLLQVSGEIYASAAEQKGIDFAISLPTETVSAWCKEKQIQRALHNLLDNALKFTPAGGKVTLGMSLENNFIHLCVEDSGIGVDEEEIENLFQRFHRGKNAAAYPGSGLGLAIVRSIAEGHRGGVEVKNLPGGGACFCLWFPPASGSAKSE